MMRSAGGALAVAVAALLVCCSADPHQEQDVAGSEHSSGEHYDAVYKQREELEDFLRFLIQYENRNEGRNLNGIGGNTLLGRNTNGLGGSSLLGRNLGGIGGSTLLGRDLDYEGRNSHGLGGSTLLGRNLNNGLGGSGLLGRNLNGIGGSTLLGREVEGGKRLYSRFVDSLGGGNFVRNLDSIGGGNFVRNLDSIGGGNFVKKNLDELGGPNLVKRNLDSLGGGNFVRNLDSIGGGHKTRNLDALGGGNLVREVRDIRRSSYVPYLMSRRFDLASPYGGKREPWSLAPVEYVGYYGDGLPKRNFDEIDRSGLDTFVKRNFDEIDRSSMPFPYATKRFHILSRAGFPDKDSSSSNYAKKRNVAEHPMDEIDLSLFPIGSQRSMGYPMVQHVLL